MPGEELGENLKEALAPVGAQIGVEFDEEGDARILPIINLGWSVGKRLARELGQFVSNCGIFLQGRRIVAVDPDTGQVEEMRPENFSTWVEDYVTTQKFNRFAGQMVDTTMSDTLAKKILAARQFRKTLRELRGVHQVRMPVFRESGQVELLKPGYDDESGIYTVESLKYKDDLPIEKAREIFVKYLGSYPWGDLEGGDKAIFQNRNAAVQLAAMLGTYSRGMFPPGTKRPMVTYIANQPGTGKSTLAVMALAPVFGYVATTDKPRDEEKFTVKLETLAQSFSPYAFFDDIGRGIFSNALNRFLTSACHTGRVFHSNSEMFEVPAVTQVFATGNGIELTPDLQRRSLVVDMFLAGEVRGREFDFRITDDLLASDECRKELLAAMWAVVRDWNEAGAKRVLNVLETFEEWTEVMGALVRFAGFADPLQVPDLPQGGDRQGRAWRLFLARLAGDGIADGEEEVEFTVTECLDKAKELEAADEFDLTDLVGNPKDVATAFGRRMQPWKGRHIIDSKGRIVEFGKRRGKARVYACQVLSERTE